MKNDQGLRCIAKSGRRSSTRQSMAQTLESRVLLSAAGISLTQQQIAQLAQTVVEQPFVQVVKPLSGSVSPLATSPIGLTPPQVRGAYGLGQVGSSLITFGAVQGDGTGQTIAIVDAFDQPNAFSDLQAFDTQFGLPDPPSFQKLNQLGQASPLPSAAPLTGNWGLEISLDIEWAHVMAPGANIDLIECNSPNGGDIFEDGVITAAGLPDVSVVSMSFGGPEFVSESTLDSIFTSTHGNTGVTFLAATGDTGSPGEYPATSQNVVAVGGTSLSVSGNTYVSETGWSGSGGGISSQEFQPSFQTPYFTSSQRTIPDVSADANPFVGGVAVYDSYDFPASPWVQVGGTSLATPLWAGMMAVVDQGRVINGKATLDGPGQTLPLLYSLPGSDFNDITSGSNGGFSAGTGYDLVTGRGSPIANLLIPALASATAPGLLPDLEPVTPPGWSAPIMFSLVPGSYTDPAMITPSEDLFLDAAWINNGATSESTSFNTLFYFGGVAQIGAVTGSGLNVGSASELKDVDLNKDFPSASIAELTESIDFDPSSGPTGDVAESTETNNTYTRTYVIDNVASDKYVLELNPSGTTLEVFENSVLVYSNPKSNINGMLFYLSGANESLTVDATNGNPIPYGQLLANGSAANDAITVNDPTGNNVVTDNASQLTLNGQVINYAGLGSITVTTGSGNDTLTQLAAPTATMTFNPGGGTNTLTDDAGTVNLTTATSGIVSLTFGTVTISAGATVSMTKSTSPNRMVLQVSVLSNSGLLDLNNNDMIVHAGNLATITTQLSKGLNLASGYWNGSTGIRSTVAAGLHNTALGVELNSNGSSVLTSTFDGQSVGITDVLVKYTYFGDANLDGTVNAADYIVIDNGFNNGSNEWQQGDFNYDGTVNGDDYTLIDNAYNTQGGVSLAAAPANEIATDTTPAATPLAVHFSTEVITATPGDDWSVSAPPPPLADEVLNTAGDDSVAQ